MATSIEDISRWLEEAKENKSTHMVVVCDTYDWEDYPVFVQKGKDINKVIKAYNGPNMAKVMEVYSMEKDIKKQLSNPGKNWEL